MPRFIYLLLLCFLASALVGCDTIYRNLTAPDPGELVDYPLGSEQNFTGNVTGFVDDCFVDGYCYLIVETERGIANVVVHPGEAIRECNNPAVINGFNAGIGDTVSVFGQVQEGGYIDLCGDPTYTVQAVTP